jgi:hypothetical protein
VGGCITYATMADYYAMHDETSEDCHDLDEKAVVAKIRKQLRHEKVTSAHFYVGTTTEARTEEEWALAFERCDEEQDNIITMLREYFNILRIEVDNELLSIDLEYYKHISMDYVMYVFKSVAKNRLHDRNVHKIIKSFLY